MALVATFSVVETLYAKNNLEPLQNNGDEHLIGDEVILYQFSQNSIPLNSMTISIPITQDLQNSAHFTVFVDVTPDGKFKKDEIAVHDIPAPVEKRLPNTFPLNFRSKKQLKNLLSLDEGDRVKTKIILTFKSEDGEHKVTKEVMAKKIFIDVGATFDPSPGFTGLSVSSTISSLTSAFQERPFGLVYAAEDTVPVVHNNVPDLKGRKGKPNECVPLSVANSLLWLANEHNFREKLAEDADGLVDELDGLLKWNKDGTKNENILPGKEAFTTNHELALENKKIDGQVTNGESDLWKKIVKELNAGEDVELILDFKETPTGKPTKGHAVTVVGADNTKTAGQTITIHDPATPAGNDTYQVARNGQILKYPLGKVFGNFIVSESFTGPTASSSPSPSPTAAPSVSPLPSPS